MILKKFSVLMILLFCITSIKLSSQVIENYKGYQSSKPYTRYWWFASMIQKEDVKYNLDWLKSHGFGGIEIAWVYPLNRFNKNDSSYTPRQEWLSKEWTEIVDFTQKYADSIGLGCDLTFGTLWPFGDTYVDREEATRKFGDTSWRQEITRSWQHPKTGYVIDHLTQKNYLPYFKRLLSAFPKRDGMAYFVDSWEVETEKLWCEGFEKDFLKENGYDIVPFMEKIYEPQNANHLYDYMKLISDKVLKFYRDYDYYLNRNGILSRGQVSGAPCDLISGYSILDIPEGESMLFEPEYCQIPASAALLSKKKIVTSETFTCLYGWPRDYIREEQSADLKLVADALFANGINQIIWHGKAHNPKDCDTVNFYATTHIGDKGNLASEITEFNKYLEKVSGYLKKGNKYSDIAIYLPTEDSWIKGYMPKEKQFIWAWGYYEMRYVYFPDELKGMNPCWINYEFLNKAKIENGRLIVGNLNVEYLYIDANYLEFNLVKKLNELAEKGLKIILKKNPENPSAVFISSYQNEVSKLNKNKNILREYPTNEKRFIESKTNLQYIAREDGNDLYIFFPQPKSKFLKFPLEYGQSLSNENITEVLTINYKTLRYNLKLDFKPYQSLLYRINKNQVEQINIVFVPATPIIKNRPKDYVAPWLVK